MTPKMIAAFLRIRFLQLARELKALGWWRTVVVAALAVGVLAVFYNWTHRSRDTWYGSCGVALAVCAVHFARKDKAFLVAAAGSVFRVSVSEYLVFTAPFLLMGLFSAGWVYTLGLPFFYAALGALPVSRTRKIRLKRSLPFLSSENFEWRSGIRMNLWPLAALYLGCLGCIGYEYASLYLWWILLALVIPFYQENEPREMLESCELPPSSFLLRKLRGQLTDYGLISAPVFVGYAVFHPTEAWIAGIVWVLSAVNLSWFILSKYAAYEPARKPQGGQLVITMVHLAMLIPMAGPFMIPVPLVLAARAYRKSFHHLNIYLDAYH